MRDVCVRDSSPAEHLVIDEKGVRDGVWRDGETRDERRLGQRTSQVVVVGCSRDTQRILSFVPDEEVREGEDG